MIFIKLRIVMPTSLFSSSSLLKSLCSLVSVLSMVSIESLHFFFNDFDYYDGKVNLYIEAIFLFFVKNK